MAGSAPERRQAWRYPVSLDVKLKKGEGVTRDLSSSGVFFETEQPLTPGQLISFSFSLEKAYADVRLDLQCKGRIVRVERGGRKLGVAVRIEWWSFEPADVFGRG